MEKEVLIVH